jgi:hypothetical protein
MKEINNQSRVFIDEEITAGYLQEPLLLKVPRYPDFFSWKGERFEVKSLLSEWSELPRRDHSSTGMRPTLLTRAEKFGSWGVGRFFFRVLTADGRTFELYYDRAPRKAGDGYGTWILYAEIHDNPGPASDKI